MRSVHDGMADLFGIPAAPATGEDPVESALARALDRASEAGRFDVVAQLARELEARRLARLTNVVALDPNARRMETP
jgi:hypothetical protein